MPKALNVGSLYFRFTATFSSLITNRTLAILSQTRIVNTCGMTILVSAHAQWINRYIILNIIAIISFLRQKHKNKCTFYGTV